MRPIHGRVVQADADPAGWAQIGRAVVKRWIAFDQHRLFFQSTGLDQQASDAAMMMIVTEIGEEFSAYDIESGAAVGQFFRRFRQEIGRASCGERVWPYV